MKQLKKTAERLTRLFDMVLKISRDDYRIVLSDRNGGMVDVYFRDDRLDKINNRPDVAIALQTVELFVTNNWQIAIHWCTSKHEQFDKGRAA